MTDYEAATSMATIDFDRWAVCAAVERATGWAVEAATQQAVHDVVGPAVDRAIWQAVPDLPCP